MTEIKEMYDKISDKGDFKERLAKVFYLTPDTVKAWFTGKGVIKKAYIPTVKKYLKLQLEIDKENKERIVEAWELVK